MEVQVFGVRKSAQTRAALRFFAERRIRVHFVDLLERPASPGELRRFAQRLGVESLVDRSSRRFADLGLAHACLSDEQWIEKLAAEPLALRMPLVRWEKRLSAGAAEGEWRAWVEEARDERSGAR